MLASVENLAEALLVLEAGADIIDLKLPSSGALGALPVETVRQIVVSLGGQRPVSATIGDLPMQPKPVLEAVEAMAATGVDFVKIGMFPGGDWRATFSGLGRLARSGVRLVAVMFGDNNPDISSIPEIADAGFSGVMLDTQNKRLGSLPHVLPVEYLRGFVAAARSQGLLCGLAGSLRHTDIPLLLSLYPDYLGFRGALCHGHERTASLDGEAVRIICGMLSCPKAP